MPINSFLYPGPTNSNPYVVDNSCRFNDGDSAYMTKSLGTPTNNDICTISLWTKFSAIGIDTGLFSQHTDSNNRFQFSNPAAGYLSLLQKTSGSTQISIATDRLFRDPSAWYHIVARCDTTNGTANIYVNGVEERKGRRDTKGLIGALRRPWNCR